MEIEIVARPADEPVELAEPMQHPTLQLGHPAHWHAFGFVELREVAEQEAQGVAELPVGVHLRLDDLGADAEIFR